MRLGTSAPLTHSGPADWARKHRSLGLGAINFHLTCEDDPHLAESFLREAEKQDLVMAEVGVWRNTLSPDPEIRKASIRYAIGQLELADRIGARCCVNILGARGPRWDGAYRDNFSGETWLLAVKTIRQIIDAVNPRNTFFTIESMPWMVPTGPDEYVRLLDAVERDRFAVHLDVFNWMRTPERYFYNEEFVDECFEKLGPYVRSCHLKDVRMEPDYTLFFREVPMGQGGINIRHLIEAGEKLDPGMPFIIEHLDSEEAYLESIRYARSLMNSSLGRNAENKQKGEQP